jgi:hypothetical protein
VEPALARSEPVWPEPVRPEPPKPVQFKPFQPKSVRIAPAVEVPLEVSPARARFDEFADAPTVPAAEPEQIVEFTLSLDGIEAKYPLLRNAF